ncbi:UDP-4-amino-4,6-dideoxy-N-acetyl-beta-L-altrosamine transaminase [Planctomycetota bacterium]|nr:UDP-4-amino-4,6-dideoxy-N-acetyl-beta-L-altrosamine transaminase [Planctomycetota bacterium]
MIPYGRQWVDEDDIAAVAACLRGDWLTTGPAVAAFEQAICSASDAAYAVAVNSGTAALHCAYFAAGLGPGDEIVTSPLTFAATANAALYLGAKPVFADVCSETGCLDPQAAAAAVTDRTKLIVPVDFAGQTADYQAFRVLATRHGLILVADAAHSFGACGPRGGKVGTLADLTALSFHPVKPVTTGEGGAVVTSDPRWAKRAAQFRTHGITRDPADLMADEGPWHYEQHELGYNYRITDLQCALGCSQVAKLGQFIARRRSIAARYREGLRECTGRLRLPAHTDDSSHGYHLWVVRVQEASRRRPFFERLRALGLGVQVHYRPVYLHPYYQQLGYRAGICPVAEDFAARCVSLPIFPKMSDDEVDSSIAAVRQAVTEVL